MKPSYSIYDMEKITEEVLNRNNKLIYVAGASASGKSFFADKLKGELEKKGKKVLALSSDSYYVNNTRLKHLIYGTFDHPKLIRYDELAKDVKKYMKTNSIKIPTYSFIESRRVGFTEFHGEVDYVIIEGLYTIRALPNFSKDMKPLCMFVDSATEELIMRRLLRDQERTKQGVDAIIGDITKVFPMWNIYGKPQKKDADIVITNEYEILDVKGEKNHFERTDISKSDLGELVKREHFIDYEYNDSMNDNGIIVISEVYKSPKADLDYVMISKRKANFDRDKHTFTTISTKSTQLGIITLLHTLIQTAGLKLQNVVKKKMEEYKNEKGCFLIKERKGKRYIAIKCEE